MEFVRSNKLTLLVIGVLVTVVAIAASVIGPRVVASFSSTLAPKSSHAEDYVYPAAGHTKAEAPVGSAEAAPPAIVVNPIALIELDGNIELSQVEVGLNVAYGTGLVTFTLNDSGLVAYSAAITELRSAGKDFSYDSLQIFEDEVSELVDLSAIEERLSLLNDGNVPETTFYQVRAVGPALDVAPTSDNPGTAIVDPGPIPIEE